MKWKKERNKKRERRRKKKDEREKKKEHKHLQSPWLSLHTGLFIEPPKAGRQRYTRNKIKSTWTKPKARQTARKDNKQGRER